MYKIVADTGNAVLRLSDGAFIPTDPANTDYATYLAWVGEGNVAEPPTPPPVLTQFELDEIRYIKRAAAKDGLIAWMAADNMSRVRLGTWTVPDLVALLADTELKSLLELINTLSFELAISAVGNLTNLLMVSSIKDAWIAKLTQNLYLD